MTNVRLTIDLSPDDLIRRVDAIMAHAWMVRTFVKHSTEVEDYPELMNAARTIFDAARALETQRASADGLIKSVRKKLSKLRQAAAEFDQLVAAEISHTNFQQAVLSFNGCIEELERLLRAVDDARPAESPDAKSSDIGSAEPG